MGNVFTDPSNRYAEFNMYLDPLAAKTVLQSTLDITLIPLSSQRKAASFQAIIEALKHSDHTPESKFVHQLLVLLHDLQQKHKLYRHMVSFCIFIFFSRKCRRTALHYIKKVKTRVKRPNTTHTHRY
jgi:inosine-uridine nucleoside N-ribohydrolase